MEEDFTQSAFQSNICNSLKSQRLQIRIPNIRYLYLKNYEQPCKSLGCEMSLRIGANQYFWFQK